jgi:hypothetical protein
MLFAALPVVVTLGVGRANAATIVVTPGEQNTASGEFQCTPAGAGCPGGGKWPYYPELLQVALGNTYTVKNTGDGGAILGCDDASKTFAGGNSFCASGKYMTSINPPPDIVIIGPFGEHDQRILAGASNANFTMFYTVAAFQAAYEGMIAKYTALKPTVKFVMMLPIDVPFNANALPAGKNIVKDVMLTAAKNAAMAHNIPIADTYTAITAAMYPVSDGQTNAAGQMKMAQLVEAALMGGGTGGTGGTAGAGGAGGAGGTGGAAGTAGAAGASGTTGTTGASGTMGTTGASGTTGTTGASGTTGTTGASGTTGTTSGTSGTTGTTSGTSGTTGTTAGTAGSGTTTGTGTGTAGAPGSGPYGHSSSGGCAVATPGSGSALGLGALGLLAAAVLGRARSRARRR